MILVVTTTSCKDMHGVMPIALEIRMVYYLIKYRVLC